MTPPVAIRKVLANLAWHHQEPVYDGGDISCNDGNLELAQHRLGEDVCHALRQRHKVMVFGGGHEVAWGSFQGIGNYLLQKQHAVDGSDNGEPRKAPRIGIINFDAHFDLRNPPAGTQSQKGSSGTPFHQIARFCEMNNWPFRYACLGLSRTSNTQALYEKADALGVLYRDDEDMTQANLPDIQESLGQFIDQCDYLYLTIDLDVFPAATAPGVSAPAARGVSFDIIEPLLKTILAAKTPHRVTAKFWCSTWRNITRVSTSTTKPLGLPPDWHGPSPATCDKDFWVNQFNDRTLPTHTIT